MKEELNNNLIKAIQEILPPQVSIATRIMEILEIGKEASYRRLRNEVPFTFYEAALVACKLGLSLDQVIGNFGSKTGVFNLNLVHTDKALNNYCNVLTRFKEYLELMVGNPTASISTVSNNIPFVLYLPYPNLIKFRLCRWLHQTDKFRPGSSLKHIFVPEEVQTLQNEIQYAIQHVPNTNMIWDTRIFEAFIKEVNYFHKLNYITGQDVSAIKEDLLSLLDKTEQIASDGCYSNGNRIHIFLSNIHFESSFTYLEKGDFRVCLLRLYSLNSIDTLHPEVCRSQKEWIKTVKCYSTLITESGQMQRIAFFKEQRKKLEQLEVTTSV
ncbi:MAG: hypothetical protein LUH10_02805 [Tannerellaceae bacterium]|nr:hypothetical protein [Tannerellaceae bacterium]